MRISFDLDDTLICIEKSVPSEPAPRWSLRAFIPKAPLRLGTRELYAQLASRGWDVCIYTTSYRSPLLTWLWLWAHGVKVSRVINQRVHEATVSRIPKSNRPTKNPSLFGIDLHVDDSEGVRIEGLAHGFKVLVISPTDLGWVAKVLNHVDECH
jgi:hypothetical protein